MRFAIVDIETTSGSYMNGKIVEIGIVIKNDEAIEKVYSTFVNPRQSIPLYITHITGIRDEDVADAPYFEGIMDEVYALLNGIPFLAHNVLFDYNFICEEFKRAGIEFSASRICTVKLSRLFYPDVAHHALEDIIERYHFQYKNRHRALDDALILSQFLDHLAINFSPESLLKAMTKQMQHSSLHAVRLDDDGKSTYDKTKEFVMLRLPLEEIALERNLSVGTIINHLTVLKNEQDIDISYLCPDEGMLERVKAVKGYPINKMKLKLGDKYSYSEILLAKLFV